jgi:hypothetical protein
MDDEYKLSVLRVERNVRRAELGPEEDDERLRRIEREIASLQGDEGEGVHAN